ARTAILTVIEPAPSHPLHRGPLMSHLRLTLLALFALALPAAADDWPQWRGVKRDGISNEKKLLSEWPKDGPELLWRAKGIGNAYSGIVIVGDRIYTMGDLNKKQRVLCLDAKKKGDVVWTAEVGPTYGDEGPRCTPVVDGKLLFAVGTDGDLVCLDATSGKLK